MNPLLTLCPRLSAEMSALTRRPSQGQEIDGKAGEIPARYRHCDPRTERLGTARLPARRGDSTVRDLRTVNTYMKKHTKPHRGQHWSAGAGRISAAALFALSSAHAATITELEPTIISALRADQPGSSVTSSVTSLDIEALQKEGIQSLRDALNEVPGVISTSTAGQNGAVSSLLIRGTTTGESLLFIDGMRANGAGNELGNLLSTSRLFNVERIEVLRGAQSAIYGGESIGGVVWMETPRGSGEPSAKFHLEAGSFNTFSTHQVYQGQTKDL